MSMLLMGMINGHLFNKHVIEVVLMQPWLLSREELMLMPGVERCKSEDT